MTKTTNKPSTTSTEAAPQDALREEFATYIYLAKTNYEEAQTKLMEDAKVNPASAITWLAEGMVKAQTAYEVWMQIEREIARHDPREALRAMLEEARYRVRSFSGSNSTSMFSNAVERARAEEYMRQAEELERLAKHHGI